MNKSLFVLTAFAAGTAVAMPGGELVVSADRMAADNMTGTLVATGHVAAALGPYRLLSEGVTGTAGDYQTLTFANPTLVTTCTNEVGHMHWCASGSVVYRAHKDKDAPHNPDEPDEVVGRDMVLKLWEIPVAWVPYAWIPLNTDYGWRVMPGYTSRWGAYVMSKYVYPLAGSLDEGCWGLSGSTRFDLRSKNGIAAGQGVDWRLGDFGRGKFKVYYAWDQDADRYEHHWNSSRHWHYANWGSTVPDERYALMAEHRWHPTERDIVRARAAYYSDSHFRGDFLRNSRFGLSNRYPAADRNELAWEHQEQTLALGLSVSGPLNDFYGGTARLPEVYLDAMPQPVFGSPVNYESASRLGWLNRTYAKHGKSSTALPFRYDPGRWADYQAFRADTYHRLTLPFKVADVVSVVPRLGARGTWWSDSGRRDLTGTHRAGSLEDDVTRSVAEGGVTFAMRGTGWLTDMWQHLVEPYADVLAQEVQYSSLRRDARPYLFDSVDGSADWLDQFAGRSRNLPYSWYGVTPGLRNAFRKSNDKGVLRTVFDLDVYAAVQLNDTSWTEGGRYHRLSRDPENPNYGRSARAMVAPGVRARWFATDDTTLMSRVEWDGENDTIAYADVTWKQRVTKSLKYEVSYSARDQRWWDYSSTPYDSATMRNEDFNWAKFNFAQLTLEHELCDAIAWGPFVRWDLRENELDEAGSWIDFRTDCLGFRFSISYENDYRRLDGSTHKDDWRCCFGVYLRALGPSGGTMFGD